MSLMSRHIPNWLIYHNLKRWYDHLVEIRAVMHPPMLIWPVGRFYRFSEFDLEIVF